MKYLQPLVVLVQTLWADIDREAAADRSLHGTKEDQLTQILVLAAVILTLVFFFCQPSTFLSLCGAALSKSPRLGRYSPFFAVTYWNVSRICLLALVPMIHIRLRGERLTDYGLGTGFFSSVTSTPHLPSESPPRVSLRTYLWLLLAILPLVIGMSFSPTFQRTYPLYRQAGRSLLELLLWELEYLSAFFAVEFFFRGYLLFGLRRAVASHAIFIAMLPYCMFHFSKPPAEALASIIAGIALGTLALASRSIWGGILLHTGVALTMDLSALIQRHDMPRSFFPL
jgi:hypothetical protein